MKKSDLFLEAYKESFANLTEACTKVGLTRTDIMRKVQADNEFARKLWEINEGFKDLAISTQFKLGLVNGGADLNSWLNAHAKDRGYGDPEKSAYSDIIKPQKEKDPKLEFQKQIKGASTDDIKEALKKIKNVKI